MNLLSPFTLFALLTLSTPITARWDNINDRRAIRPSTVTRIVTVTPTATCTPCENPKAVATFVAEIVPPVAPAAGPDYVAGLRFGAGWGHIACETYCSSSCPETKPFCDPSCSNKGTCGLSSRTNLYLGGLIPSPLSPEYTIRAAAPARSFSITQLLVTAGITDFISAYPHINFEVRSWDRLGNQNPTKTFIIPKPPNSVYYSLVRVDLVGAGIGDVSKLEFLPWHEGSLGSGGQGEGGRILASVKLDGDGFGGGIPYQVFTPVC